MHAKQWRQRKCHTHTCEKATHLNCQVRESAATDHVSVEACIVPASHTCEESPFNGRAFSSTCHAEPATVKAIYIASNSVHDMCRDRCPYRQLCHHCLKRTRATSLPREHSAHVPQRHHRRSCAAPQATQARGHTATTAQRTAHTGAAAQRHTSTGAKAHCDEINM